MFPPHGVTKSRSKRLDAYIILNENKYDKFNQMVPAGPNRNGLKIKRHKRTIDLDQIHALACIGCTYEEMSQVIGCSKDYIIKQIESNPAFAIAIERGHGEMKSSLRRAQLDEAINNRSSTLLIWLGKQYLGQTDKQQIESKHEINITVQRAMDELRNIPKEQLLAAQEMLTIVQEKTPGDETEG